MLLGLVGLFGGTSLVQALTIQSATLDEITNESPLVVQGEIIDRVSQWDNAQRNIYTYNTLRIQRVIKGEYTPETVVVRELGGRVGEVSARVNGLRYLEQGDKVVLFLRATAEEEVYKIHSFALGRFSVVTHDGVTEVRHALGDSKAFQYQDEMAPQDISDKAPSMELDRFIRKVTQVKQK